MLSESKRHSRGMCIFTYNQTTILMIGTFVHTPGDRRHYAASQGLCNVTAIGGYVLFVPPCINNNDDIYSIGYKWNSIRLKYETSGNEGRIRLIVSRVYLKCTRVIAPPECLQIFIFHYQLLQGKITSSNTTKYYDTTF